MVKVSSFTEKRILGNNRDFASSVTLDFASLRFDKSVAIRAENACDNCAPDQIIDPAAAYNGNWWFLGQRLPLVPVKNRVNRHKAKGYVIRLNQMGEKVGYVGSLADEQGNVNDSVGLRFSKRQVSQIVLSSPSDKLLVDYRIDVLFNSRVVASIQRHDNSLVSETIEVEPILANELWITVTRCSPHRRVSILNFNPSLFKNYNSHDIIDWSYELKKSSGAGELSGLYIGSLLLKFWNSCHVYDFDNTASKFYGMLSGGESVSVSLTQCGVDFSQGVFFANEWKVKDGVVSCQATDTLGMIKDQKIIPDIVSDTNAYRAFRYISEALGFQHSEIDSSLSLIRLNDFCPMGSVGSVLSDLCKCSNSICLMNSTGTGFVVKRLDALLANKRYPDRYLSLDDYVKADEKNNLNSPNIIKMTFSLFEKELKREKIKEVIKRYKDIPSLEYPEPLKLIPTYNREIGAGLEPSWVLRDEIPEATKEIEFSDAFSYGSLEFYAAKENDRWVVRIWNFGNASEQEQLSVICYGEPVVHKPGLLADVNHEIPVNPSYTGNPKVDEPVIVEHSMSERIRIHSVVPGNVMNEKFRFELIPTGTGYLAKVWNWLPVNQTFNVKVYGTKVVASQKRQTLVIRDEAKIRQKGEIEKTVTLELPFDEETALRVLRGIAGAYLSFSGTIGLENWTDLRLQVGDRLAYQSLRYGKVHGVIDSITLKYDGLVEQSLGLLKTDKHNRDSRVHFRSVLEDRPAEKSI